MAPKFVTLLLLTSIVFNYSVEANDLYITVDEALLLYIDGVLIEGLPNYKNWSVADVVPLTSSVSVIAVDATDNRYPGGVLASDTDGTILTNQSWKCVNVFYLSDTDRQEWMNINYDDSLWPQAVELYQNDGSSSTWSTVEGISSIAWWIWGSVEELESQVYCRLTLSGSETTTMGSTTRAPPEVKCEWTGPSCIGSCSGVADGNYQWCGQCAYFVQCSNGIMYLQPCSASLVWDDRVKNCLGTSTSCEECYDYESRTCNTTGDACISSCETLLDGDYQWCGQCDYYAQCNSEILSVVPCSSELEHWENATNECADVSLSCTECQALNNDNINLMSVMEHLLPSSFRKRKRGVNL